MEQLVYIGVDFSFKLIVFSLIVYFMIPVVICGFTFALVAALLGAMFTMIVSSF